MSVINLTSKEGTLYASVVVPGSKSVANRALVCALLADGESVINGVPSGDDTMVLLNVAEEMGQLFRVQNSTVAVRGSRSVNLPGIIDARLAGTSSRFLTAFAVLGNTTCIIDGEGPLRLRPMLDLHDALSSLGAEITHLGEVGHLPVLVSKGVCEGGSVVLRGDVSSQFISALMLIGPMLAKGLYITIDGPLVSASYVQMTARVMRSFGASVEIVDNKINIATGGYVSCTYEVEPDYSSAGFPLAAVVLREGQVTIPNLALSNLQGDAEILDILRVMGVRISKEGSDIVASRDADQPLQPIERDMSNCSDLVPAVAVACLGINGVSRIHGVGFIRHKESDRLGDLASELQRAGAEVEVTDDGLIIHGGSVLHKATFETHHDHRLAMALALLALRVETVGIADPLVVSKSWPTYFDDMNAILSQLSPSK